MTNEATQISVVMAPGKYSMHRESDGAGDSGPLLISVDPYNWKTESDNGTIVIGLCLRCGSISGRTFAAQDWWQTSRVVSIDSQELGEGGVRKVTLTTKSGQKYTVESF